MGVEARAQYKVPEEDLMNDTLQRLADQISVGRGGAL